MIAWWIFSVKTQLVTFSCLTGNLKVCYMVVILTFCSCCLWVSRIATWHPWVIGLVFGFVRRGFWVSFKGIVFSGSISRIFSFTWPVFGPFRVIIEDGPFENWVNWFRSSFCVSRSIICCYLGLVFSSSSWAIHYPSLPNFPNPSTTSSH